MYEVIQQMLKKYECENFSDYTNALKEIIQEIALLGLWRSKFFEKAAFYGGTALRILYQLDRFSEDLDFSLLKPDLNFSLEKYNQSVQEELFAFGFNTKIEKKEKNLDSNMVSAFIKAQTKEQLLYIQAPNHLTHLIPNQQKIKIKMEIDVNPPGLFHTESKILLEPIPFAVNVYSPPDLFAGKIHALICRSWALRVKGRDWYDLVWYVTHRVPLNLTHLQARLEQSGHFSEQSGLLAETQVLFLIDNKINTLDVVQAKKDILPFLKNQEMVKIWNKDFFRQVIQKIRFIRL